MGKTRSTIFSRQKALTDSKANKENEKLKKPRNRPELIISEKNDNEKAKSKDKRSSKQKFDNNRSLRRMKSKGIARQVLQTFPKEPNLISKKMDHAVDENYDVPSELYPGKQGYIKDNMDEDIYESRKLLIRQIQGQIAKEVAGNRVKKGSGSGYDSWSDLEENFALAYEPIPLNIKMDTWRKMTKNDILRTVRSVKMRKEFEYMSRSEILGKIEVMQKSAKYLSEKFGVNHLLPAFAPTDPNPQIVKQKLAKSTLVRAEVHHNHPISNVADVNGNPQDDLESVLTDFSTVINPYVSRSEILKFYDDNPPPKKLINPNRSSRHPMQLQNSHKEMMKKNLVSQHDSWSSRASSILNSRDSVYISRNGLLQNIEEKKMKSDKLGKFQKQRIHDSWSSRASSILARSTDEPPYMSRAELLGNIALFGLLQQQQEELGLGQSNGERPSTSSSGENDSSSVSTVKKVVLVRKKDLYATEDLQRGKYLAKTLERDAELHPEIISCSNDSSDGCSCESCATYSDCSCCGSETATNSSTETVVETLNTTGPVMEKGKRRDSYTAIGIEIASQKSHRLVLKPDQISKPKIRQNHSNNQTGRSIHGRSADSWSNSEFEKIFEPVQADDIKRQRNSRALKKYLKEIAQEWDSEINDMNTLRRNKVLKQLNTYLKETIDLGKIQTGDLGLHIEVALRQALDAHFETMSNLNLGHMYVPMEENPNNSKVVSRENTDYDTFESIDSLIFEPKVPTHEDIKEVQEEIEQQFDYLNQMGCDDDVSFKQRRLNDVIGPGKTTFAERVKLFQKLGKKEMEADEMRMATPVQRPVKKITVLEVDGQETTWKEVAKAKDGIMNNPKFNKNPDPLFPKKNPTLHEEGCPDCRSGEESLITSNICSTCDCCTECNQSEDEEAPTENPYNFGTTTASWDFEKVPSDIRTQLNLVEKTPQQSTTILKQRLKEAFGIDITGNLDGTFDLSDQHSFYERLTYGSSSVERDVDHQEDFLIEYGKKHNLLKILHMDDEEEESQSKGGSSSALFFRNGKPVNITEEMFRGDFFQNSPKVLKTLMQSTDLPDSGIGSPPNCNDHSIIIEEEEGVSIPSSTHKHLEKGSLFTSPPEPPPLPAPPSQLSTILLHPKPNGTNNPPIKKRDTMIRELKTKLKEKFNIGDAVGNCSENLGNSKTMINRESVLVPKLSRVFETRRVLIVPKVESEEEEEQNVIQNLENSIEPSFILKNCENLTLSNSPLVAVPMVVEISRQESLLGARETPSGSSFTVCTVKDKLSRKSESPKGNSRFDEMCFDEPIQRAMTASPQETREVLYGPGGIFGPKGPFSTPNVRYPFGMEVGLSASNIPKRFVHFDAKQPSPSRFSRKSPGISSDLSSPAEDRSDKSHYVILNDTMQMPTGPTSPITSASCESKPSSRIEMYQSGWTESQQALPTTRSTLPAKQPKWREEKNLRMLAWVNHSHSSVNEQEQH